MLWEEWVPAAVPVPRDGHTKHRKVKWLCDKWLARKGSLISRSSHSEESFCSGKQPGVMGRHYSVLHVPSKQGALGPCSPWQCLSSDGDPHPHPLL